MPNWCVQNWILRGPKESVRNFCDTVNKCLTSPDVMPNGFGKFWLGNLCVAFGYEYRNDCCGLRGNFDPDPSCYATLMHPDAEEKGIEPVEISETDSEIRFSVTHAWSPSLWFQEMLDEKYPELEQAWKATDEFGNFHTCLNIEAFGLKKYEIETWGPDGEDKCFGEKEHQQVADYLNGLTENTVNFTVDDILKGEDHIAEKLSQYNQEHEDEEIYVYVWEEE